MGGVPSFIHLSRRQQVASDALFSATLAQFVEQISGEAKSPSKIDVEAVVQSAIDKGLAKNVKRFAARAGLASSTLHQAMYSVDKRRSISVLLRLAGAAETGMAGILYPHLTAPAAAPTSSLWSQLPRIKVNVQHDWEDIRATVVEAVNSGEGRSLFSLAAHVRVTPAQLAEQLRDLRPQIDTQQRENRKARNQAKLDQMVAEISQARRALVDQGLRVTTRAIGRALKRSTGSPYMRRALKIAETCAT